MHAPAAKSEASTDWPAEDAPRDFAGHMLPSEHQGDGGKDYDDETQEASPSRTAPSPARRGHLQIVIAPVKP